MNRFWQILALVLVCAVSGVYFLADALAPSVRQALPAWLLVRQYHTFEQHGGSAVVLQMDAAGLQGNWLDAMRDEARRELRGMREGAKAEPLGYAALDIQEGAVRVVPRGPADLDKVLTRLKSMPSAGGLAIEPESGGAAVTLRVTEEASARRTGEALQGAMAVFERRLASMSIADAVIRRQADRITVQVPGVADPAALAQLLSVPARLGFHLVDDSVTVEEVRNGRRPAGSVIYESADSHDSEPFLVKKEALITGEDIADANGSLDVYSGGQAAVAFIFTPAGARKFAEITKANVGRPFAIVLDGKVISAPVIREPITGGSGIISGNFTLKSAAELAAQLRAGALPAPFTVIESRYQPPAPAR